jgi:hypothetical protein
MKTLDLINIMILNEFNQFKTLVKKIYSSFVKDNYIYLNVYNIRDIYNFENITKSEDECRSLMKKWLHYGLVEKYSYYAGLVIKIYI